MTSTKSCFKKKGQEDSNGGQLGGDPGELARLPVPPIVEEEAAQDGGQAEGEHGADDLHGRDEGLLLRVGADGPQLNVQHLGAG